MHLGRMNNVWQRTFRKRFKKFIGNFYFRLRNHLQVLLWRVCLRAKCDIQDRRFRIFSAALLRQVRLCFAGTGWEILNSNPVERLGEHYFILYLVYQPHSQGLSSGCWFTCGKDQRCSLVLSERRVTNHVLVFSICALSKLRVVFVCNVFLHYEPFIWRFYVTFFEHFLGLFSHQLNWNKQIDKTNTMLNGILIKYLIWINFVFQEN